LEGAQNLRPGSVVVETLTEGSEDGSGNNMSKFVDLRTPDKIGKAEDN